MMLQAPAIERAATTGVDSANMVQNLVKVEIRGGDIADR